MTLEQFEKVLKKGESNTVEFKSWFNAKDFKQRINLVVPELIAFANTKGGTVYLGVEDTGEVTGCDEKYNPQNILESIYSKTRPPLFVEINEIIYQEKKVIALTVENDGIVHATNDGKCLKRLGKNSMPWYPSDFNRFYSSNDNIDFSRKIIAESSLEDVDKLEVYKLKEKLKTRDPNSTLFNLDDISFLKDLGLIADDYDSIKLTIAGMLFVGKENSIHRFLPQAEVIYLKYKNESDIEYSSRLDLKLPIVSLLDRLTETIEYHDSIINVQIGLFKMEIHDYSMEVFQEALLNAISHRDYESVSSIYVKHYPNRIVIENPGGFIDGVTEENIITHVSAPRNKLIAETLQRLKYVQRSGQGVDIIYRSMIMNGKPYPIYSNYSDSVQLTLFSATEDIEFVKYIMTEQEKYSSTFSLSELMILRYLTDNRIIKLNEAIKLTQCSENITKKSLNSLRDMRLIENFGNKYTLTERVYESMGKGIDYTKDLLTNYIKSKQLILEYIEKKGSITRSVVEELCGVTEKQARNTLEKMQNENLITISGAGRSTKYILK